MFVISLVIPASCLLRYVLYGPVSKLVKWSTLFSFPKRPDRTCDPPSIQFNRHQGSFSVQSGRGVMLTAHLHLVSRLRIVQLSSSHLWTSTPCTGALRLVYHTDCCLRPVQCPKWMVNYCCVKRKVLLLHTEEQGRQCIQAGTVYGRILNRGLLEDV